MLERHWKTLGGERVADMSTLLRQELRNGGKDIHVGTDSQQSGKGTEYVTVLVVLTPGKGGRVFWTRERVARVRQLRERLYREVWMSTELAMELNATPDIDSFGSLMDGNDLTIHVDANPDKRFRSSDYVQELAGMVVGQGFKVLLKPDSWAATHAADHVVKNKVIGENLASRAA